MYILGASTLGRMVFDVARDLGVGVRGFVDDVSTEPECSGVSISGCTGWLLALARSQAGVAAFVAVGDNQNRANLFRTLMAAGVSLPTLVHPRAYIAPSAVLGAGNLVMAHAYIGTGVTLGDANLVFPGVCLTHDNRIGDANFFAPGVSVGGRTTVPDLCKFGMNSALRPDLSISSGFICDASAIVG